jgi:hypothetical protein
LAQPAAVLHRVLRFTTQASYFNITRAAVDRMFVVDAAIVQPIISPAKMYSFERAPRRFADYLLHNATISASLRRYGYTYATAVFAAAASTDARYETTAPKQFVLRIQARNRLRLAREAAEKMQGTEPSAN